MVLARTLGNYHVVLPVHPFIVLFWHKMQKTILLYHYLTLNACVIKCYLCLKLWLQPI